MHEISFVLASINTDKKRITQQKTQEFYTYIGVEQRGHQNRSFDVSVSKPS